MPVFTYRGVNRAGAKVTGERTAESKAEVRGAPPRKYQRQQALREGEGVRHPYLRWRR